MNLNELARRVSEINEANGWTIDPDDRIGLGLKIALVASEGAELLEELRKIDGEEQHRAIVEAADTMIRVLHLCDRLGIDAVHAGYAETVPFVLLTGYESAVARGVIMPAFRAFELVRSPEPLDELRKLQLANEFGTIIRACEGMVEALAPSNPEWPDDPGVLYRIIDQKLEKNRGRGHKHGGKHF